MPRVRIEDLYQPEVPTPTTKVIEGTALEIQPPVKRGLPEHLAGGLSTLPEARIPFGPLRKINPKQLHGRRDLMEQLNGGLQLNDSELPEFIYRPDLLDVQAFKQLADPTLRQDEINDLQSQLEAAAVPLKYYEGYPSLPNGLPFWTQLEYESKDAFEAFLTYQQMGGARTLETLIYAGEYELGQLLDWFHMYFWNFRVIAFDMFKVVRHQKLKLLRSLNVEDSHFLLAERLMGELSTYLASDDFKLTELKPLEAITMLEKITKLQRISAGLSEKGGFSDEVIPPKVQPVEVIMRQIASPKTEVTEDVEVFDVLKESPENVELAQELIIRMNQPKSAP